MSSALFGATVPAIMVTKIGNSRRVVLLTLLGEYSMRMRRSFFVVMALIIGGCIIGTRAMYEYAATIIAP